MIKTLHLPESLKEKLRRVNKPFLVCVLSILALLFVIYAIHKIFRTPKNMPIATTVIENIVIETILVDKPNNTFQTRAFYKNNEENQESFLITIEKQGGKHYLFHAHRTHDYLTKYFMNRNISADKADHLPRIPQSILVPQSFEQIIETPRQDQSE